MSAVPKTESPAFWMEARVIEFPAPPSREMPPLRPAAQAEVHRTSEVLARPRDIPLPSLANILKYERAICFALILFVLMILCAVSHQGLVKNIKARDAQMSIQQAHQDIGQLREELQQARAGLETFDAPEGSRTMPLEPGEVATVTLPAPAR